MRIAGFKKQSLIDYPGNISSVVFTQGCNFRCGFCHNPDLVLPEKFGSTYRESEIYMYLKKYSRLLDAVCITGGEPTIHQDLPQFIRTIKDLGLKIKLDSNGTNPRMLEELIHDGLVDCIAMDVKHVLEFNRYNQTVGNCITEDSFSKILNSIELIKQAEIESTFRTTVVKDLHTPANIRFLKENFKENYQIQNLNEEIVLNPSLKLESFPESEFMELVCS